MGDDGYVPVICPTCQKDFAVMPATAGYFAWSGLGAMLCRKFGS
jgi:hypothetical protein